RLSLFALSDCLPDVLRYGDARLGEDGGGDRNLLRLSPANQFPPRACCPPEGSDPLCAALGGVEAGGATSPQGRPVAGGVDRKARRALRARVQGEPPRSQRALFRGSLQ